MSVSNRQARRIAEQAVARIVNGIYQHPLERAHLMGAWNQIDQEDLLIIKDAWRKQVVDAVHHVLGESVIAGRDGAE